MLHQYTDVREGLGWLKLTFHIQSATTGAEKNTPGLNPRVNKVVYKKDIDAALLSDCYEF
jgi:hypothetical protein